jgi:DMSO/TMAO reductase YedYZ molybdopterin-dependent catalytic subunit
MIHIIRNYFIIAAISLPGSAFAAEKVDDPSKFVTTSISISGAVEKKLTLRIEDLKKFPPQQIGEIQVTRQTGTNIGKREILKGVLLKDILEKAAIIAPGHNDLKKMVIIATASDDYKVVFSWNEVFNSPLGDGVIVYFEKDGKPLDDNEGRIAMISAKDIRTGARHVLWLKEIEVRKIVE